jgi:hypothetical protein
MQILLVKFNFRKSLERQAPNIHFKIPAPLPHDLNIIFPPTTSMFFARFILSKQILASVWLCYNLSMFPYHETEFNKKEV